MFYGGIVSAVLVLTVLLAAFAGYRYVHGLVDQYADTKPVALPTVKLSDEEISKLHERVKTFTRAVGDGKATEPLVLTADEVNALIATNATSEVHQHVYVTLEGDQAIAQVSIPADSLMLRGCYFNGEAAFSVSLHNGELVVNLTSLSVKGKPLPDSFMAQIRHENFAAGWTNDPDLSASIRKLEDVQITNSKVAIVPKKP